jgi:hypothetical protein
MPEKMKPTTSGIYDAEKYSTGEALDKTIERHRHVYPTLAMTLPFARPFST